ncbi:MAG: macrocin-O-methyltransferase, partial [Candidatus Saganbacteria bacterium]|nr:macrocin-O-methyltransferase [Candidatus Saganbacteria bacterium]
MSWANFLEIRNMGDRQKQVIGFDNFSGFVSFDKKDGKIDKEFRKQLGGFDGGVFEEILKDAISIYDK